MRKKLFLTEVAFFVILVGIILMIYFFEVLDQLDILIKGYHVGKEYYAYLNLASIIQSPSCLSYADILVSTTSDGLPRAYFKNYDFVIDIKKLYNLDKVVKRCAVKPIVEVLGMPKVSGTGITAVPLVKDVYTLYAMEVLDLLTGEVFRGGNNVDILDSEDSVCTRLIFVKIRINEKIYHPGVARFCVK